MVGAGLELGTTLAALTLLGYWLDQKWGTLPWLTIVLGSLALVSGTYRLWKQGSRYFRGKKDQ